MNNDIGESRHQYMYLLLKLNVDILVNRMRDCLLGNMVDLT